jgi:hypothetical protein
LNFISLLLDVHSRISANEISVLNKLRNDLCKGRQEVNSGSVPETKTPQPMCCLSVTYMSCYRSVHVINVKAEELLTTSMDMSVGLRE